MAAATHVLVRCTVLGAGSGSGNKVVPLRIPVEDRLLSVGELSSKAKSGLENWLRLEGSGPDSAGYQRVLVMNELRWCDTPCAPGRELDYYLPMQRPLVLTVNAYLQKISTRWAAGPPQGPPLGLAIVLSGAAHGPH